MNQRYFIELSFKGTPFCGWQKQDNGLSVQTCVEKALSTLLKTTTEIVGTGRTDAGVHARNYIAHFDSPHPIKSIDTFIHQLNQILPYEISVQNLNEVKNTAHARFDAISRTYEYQCVFEKSPFEKDYTYYLKYKVDINLLNEASLLLLQYSDFTSFCKLHSDNKTNICKIYSAQWREEKNKLIFKIKADRFLRNMVRALVGTLLKVGAGKISVNEFKEIIESRNRAKAGISAPAHALFFCNVEFSKEIYLNY